MIDLSKLEVVVNCFDHFMGKTVPTIKTESPAEGKIFVPHVLQALDDF